MPKGFPLGDFIRRRAEDRIGGIGDLPVMLNTIDLVLEVLTSRVVPIVLSLIVFQESIMTGCFKIENVRG